MMSSYHLSAASAGGYVAALGHFFVDVADGEPRRNAMQLRHPGPGPLHTGDQALGRQFAQGIFNPVFFSKEIAYGRNLPGDRRGQFDTWCFRHSSDFIFPTIYGREDFLYFRSLLLSALHALGFMRCKIEVNDTKPLQSPEYSFFLIIKEKQ